MDFQWGENPQNCPSPFDFVTLPKEDRAMAIGNVLFCSLAILDPMVGHTMDVLSLFISILRHSDWLFHIQVLSMTWRCLSRPCVVFLACVHLALFLISFSRQFPCFLMVWPQHASFLALTVSNSSPFTPALLRTHSFVFFAVHETRRICTEK